MGKPLVCHGDLGDDPHDWADPWRITPQGKPSSGGNSYGSVHNGDVGVTSSGCIDGDGGPRGG